MNTKEFEEAVELTRQLGDLYRDGKVVDLASRRPAPPVVAKVTQWDESVVLTDSGISIRMTSR